MTTTEDIKTDSNSDPIHEEIATMGKISRLLGKLSPEARARAVAWLIAVWGVKQ